MKNILMKFILSSLAVILMELILYMKISLESKQEWKKGKWFDVYALCSPSIGAGSEKLDQV